MLSNWVETRTTVQTTVVSLTIGLAALAGGDRSHVGQLDQVCAVDDLANRRTGLEALGRLNLDRHSVAVGVPPLEHLHP